MNTKHLHKVLLSTVFTGLGILVLPAQMTLADSQMPSIHIQTPESPFVEKTKWQDGEISILSQTYPDIEMPARIRGRGNSTWDYGEAKRPLRFRLSAASSVFGSDYEATDWILLANLFDASLLRNYGALTLAKSMDMYALQTIENTHLYVNDTYMGVYLLTDERDTGEGRLEIDFDKEAPAKSSYFIELDMRAPNEGDLNVDYILVDGLPFGFKFPSTSAMTDEHFEYLQDFMDNLSFTIRTGSFEEVAALIDVPSFVDYYLLQELFKNSDGPLSNFMYLTGEDDNRRLHMGPAWDFDITAGIPSSLPLGDTDDAIIMGLFSLWYRPLMNMPEFFELVSVRFEELQQEAIPMMIEAISQVSQLYLSDFERNFERHPLPHTTFEAEVSFLIDWLEARTLFLEEFLSVASGSFNPLSLLLELHQTDRPISISINGDPQELNISPIILNERVLVPLSEISNILDVTTSHDMYTNLITTQTDLVAIKNMLGSPIFYVDGTPLDLIVESLRIEDEVFIPIRILSEALHYDISWDGERSNLNLATRGYTRAVILVE